MDKANYEIMDAREFYEKTLVSQRRVVNDAIRSAMEHCAYTVKLPTQLYVKIADKLKALGWEEEIVNKNENSLDDDGVSYIYPICVCSGCELPERIDDYSFVSAREFYDVTLKNQYEDLCNKIVWSVANGFSEVKLSYKSYPAIIVEMSQNGWEHSTCYEADKTKEECSMYYPLCGFEED